MPSANPRRWSALAVIALAQFIVIMDTSIIGVALPEIQQDLGFSPDDLSWVFNAYVIAFGGLLLLGGRLSDLLGAKRVFTAAGSSSPRVARRRPGGIDHRRDRVACSAGRRRGAHRTVGADAADDALRVQSQGAHEGVRHLRRGRPGRRHRRRVPRRRHHRVGQLAVGLLRQHPDRAAGARGHPVLMPSVPARRGSIDIAGATTATAGLALTVFGIVRAPEEGWGSSATLLAHRRRPRAARRVRRDPGRPA